MKLVFLIFLLSVSFAFSQSDMTFPKQKNSVSGIFSIGTRSSFSAFGTDFPATLGIGGNIRVQLSERINTDWFADYFSNSIYNFERKDYHIGWSVMYYLRKNNSQKKWQPYLLAGHCFDMSQINYLTNSTSSLVRKNSAIQGGIGASFALTNRLDVATNIQFMSHLGKDFHLHFDECGNLPPTIKLENHASFEGHLLISVGINFKLFDAWGRN